MPLLSAETTDYRLGLEADQRTHWFVGRDPACELLLLDEGISRFHATVLFVEDRYYLIDHSLNGTHVFRGDEEFRVARDTPRTEGADAPDKDADVVGFETTEIEPVQFLLPSIDAAGDDPRPIDVHASYMELKIIQRQSRVPSLPGFRRHAYSTAAAALPLLEMLQDEGDRANLAGMGREIRPGDVLLFHGFDRHFFRFTE